MSDKAYWVKGPSRMGFTPVFVVDEHGCLLNTEPACSVPDRYADWFMVWLLAQPCPYPNCYPLLEHIPSFMPPIGPQEPNPDPNGQSSTLAGRVNGSEGHSDH